MCSERHEREKQKMKLDVYEVYCITHREAKGLHFYKREREREHTQTKFCEPSATEKINKFIFFLEQKYEEKTREREQNEL